MVRSVSPTLVASSPMRSVGGAAVAMPASLRQLAAEPPITFAIIPPMSEGVAETAALRVLAELEPKAEELLRRHLAMAEDWFPHEYVPWSRGRDFDREPWALEQSALSLAARSALEINLLT